MVWLLEVKLAASRAGCLTSVPLPPQDWAKSSSCEPSLSSAVHRRRESGDKMRDLEAPPSPLCYSAVQHDETQRRKSGQGVMASKVRPCGTLAALLGQRLLTPVHFSHVCLSARWAAVPGSQYAGHGPDPRPDHGAAEEQQRLTAVLQRLQQPDQHSFLLRGHHPLPR